MDSLFADHVAFGLRVRVFGKQYSCAHFICVSRDSFVFDVSPGNGFLVCGSWRIRDGRQATRVCIIHSCVHTRYSNAFNICTYEVVVQYIYICTHELSYTYVHMSCHSIYIHIYTRVVCDVSRDTHE